ncbi:MAG TPA: hypothetical protein DCL54_03880 [Alphaproteobacteria bacterium]|nr:hypothetical protein [Alphaproteobacteria bacterium]HAJ45704.1 hypothetical protein [Alphaproteobacteria bacterium]
MTEIDKAARMAAEANIKVDPLARLYAWWDDQNTALRTIVTIAGGAVIATFICIEGNSSGQGWLRAMEGTAPAVALWVFGFACTLGYIVSHRIASEAIRDKQKWQLPVAAAVFTASLSLFGVVANQIERAQTRTVVSGDVGTARGDAIARVRGLQTRVNAFDEVTMLAILEADQRALAAAQAEATGWGMVDLDPAGACNADLKPRQRQLCNEVNGPDGLIASITITQAALDSHQVSKAALAEAEAQLGGLKAERTSNFWRGMAEIVPGEDSDMEARTARTSAIGSLIMSIVILFSTAFMIDVVLEYRERRRERIA